MTKSVTELVEELLNQANLEVEEFNVVFDQKEKVEEENSFLKLQIETLKRNLEETGQARNELHAKYSVLKSQSDQILGNGEKHLNAAKQAYRKRDQMADKLGQATDQLAAYKAIGTPKKIRERIKDYQSKVTDGTSHLNKAKETIKGYRREIDKQVSANLALKANEVQTNMTSIWSENGDNLMIFPAKLSMQVGGIVEKQLPLLFMTESGCGKLISLDEDGQPAVCSMPKGGMKPKAKTLAVAGEMLRKFKRQGWSLEVSDLDLSSK